MWFGVGGRDLHPVESLTSNQYLLGSKDSSVRESAWTGVYPAGRGLHPF